MNAYAVAWGVASDHLPARGTLIYFSLHNDRRARSGCFVNGGFNDVASGNHYAPGSVDSWLAFPARHHPTFRDGRSEFTADADESRVS
jgi:hypothetical protein